MRMAEKSAMSSVWEPLKRREMISVSISFSCLENIVERSRRDSEIEPTKERVVLSVRSLLDISYFI